MIARWLARRAGQGTGMPAAVQAPAMPRPPAVAEGRTAEEERTPAAAAPGTAQRAAIQTPATEGPVAPKPLPAAPSAETSDSDALPAPQPDAAGSIDADPVAPSADGPSPSAEETDAPQAGLTADPFVSPAREDDAAAEARRAPVPTDPSEAEAEAESAAGPATGPAPGEHKVITLVSLVPHSGARTLCAALEGRVRERGWQIRATGPGLARAAFSGMLTDTDALVLIAPEDPETTASLGGRLEWLEANNRPTLPSRTIFVINLGPSGTGALQLPADLSRPVILLPFDPALALPRAGERAPRRAGRRALDQLIDELTTILQEH